MAESACTVPDCAKGGKLTGGLCGMHYTRLKRHGDVNAPDGRKRAEVRKTCGTEGCDREVHGRGLCLMHYKRERSRGSLEPRPPGPKRPEWITDPATPSDMCGVPGCQKPRRSKVLGLCEMHYQRLRRYGDVNAGTRRAARKCAVESCHADVHNDGLCRLHSWRKKAYGDPLALPPERPVGKYKQIAAKGHPVAGGSGIAREHRLVLYDAIGEGPHPCYWCGTSVNWMTGSEAIRNLVVDHLDHDKLNNDPANLVPSCNGCNGHRLNGALWIPWRPGDPVGAPVFKRQCSRGHALTAENVYIQPNGGHRCRICLRRRRHEYNARQRALA